MNAAVIALICLLLLFIGYRFYSKFLSSYIFRTSDSDETTPAVEFNDGVDYVPTKKHVLFGHHFSSIAGAAPILGPAIAIIWGWVPALVWVVIGSIFMGAVHDYGALVISARNKGKSIGQITESIIGKRSKMLFLTVIFLLVFIVIAVFAYIIATLFVNYPSTVIPINFQIIIAIFIGWWAYKKKKSLLLPSLAALLLLYYMIYVGFQYPVHLPEYMWVNGSEVMTWILFLLVYGFVASILPVWTLLQPRDYINSHQLIVGLIAIYLGIIVAQPIMDAPAFKLSGNPIPWFPFLFITIACGAISGFHGLVSSGTTAKQLANMKDSRFIGYGGMIGEATLAIAATIAVAAGFENSAAWHNHYDNFELAKGLGPKLSAFVNGTAGFLSEIGITQTMIDAQGNSRSLAAAFIGVMVISFAATSLDTAVRIQRYIIGEIGEAIRVRPLAENRYLQSAAAVLFSLVLVLSDGTGAGGLKLWPLFGATNQLLGSLTLLVISLWLYQHGRQYWYTLAPMLFITAITFIATYFNLLMYLDGENYLLVTIALVIGVSQLWIIFEGIKTIREQRIQIKE
ncbi:MAG TPA: carbon starvation protein A [Flavobacteriales bacterium]|nr:carbon starvation protein A [Flavobacteriales bacterium]HIN40642.1 carbon starvation protein A [Flavobacteriales bacterium]